MTPTKANTEFMNWWKLLNEALAKRGLDGAVFSEARGTYHMGETPEEAARNLMPNGGLPPEC